MGEEDGAAEAAGLMGDAGILGAMVTKKSDKASVRRTSPKGVTPSKRRVSTWDDLLKIGRAIPDEDLAKLPPDLVKNFDHYAHGSPRED
jgi:hypothetical protein